MDYKNLKVLIVDDFDLARNMARKELSNIGIELVTESLNGVEAFQLLEKAHEKNEPFHLVLSDWHMKDGAGIEFLRKIRQDDRFKQLMFVMVSAESESESIVQALHDGANDYICKPLAGEVFKKKIHRMLSKKTAA